MSNALKTAVLSPVAWVRRLVWRAAGVGLLSGLTACYVVPLDPRVPPPSVAATSPAPSPVVLTARLYPANELGARHGMVNAHVSNDLHGKGTFSAVIGSESFAGEATRRANSNREGLANGIGNKGGYLNCQYTMNSSTQGSGHCSLHDGAQFTMHLSQ